MKKFLTILAIMFFTMLNCFAENIVLPSQIGQVKDLKYVDYNNSSMEQTVQKVDVLIKTGEFKGQTIELENALSGNPYYDINLKKGSNVILHVEDTGDGLDFSIEDIKRSNVLVWLGLIFCSLLVYVGRKKGIFSLVAIILTLFMITKILSPMVLFGINPIFSTILICVLSTVLTIYLVGGFNYKSSSAILGTSLSLCFAGILAYFTMFLANLSGFASEQYMFLYSAHPELDFIKITIGTIILATLGAVMDVAMSIASTINEIYLTDSTKTVKELFYSGMNVGRDIIGTMANTLIFVYVGGSLPLIMLANNIDFQKFINLNQVVTEISSALIGSIAIVICVPITAFISAELVKKTKKSDGIDFSL